jgi:16S rRNA (cytosine967-C5)-methyltransferase
MAKGGSRAPGGRAGAASAPNARRIALDVLDRVLGPDRRPLEETFQGHPALGRLEPRDRAFARLLSATVLRRQGQIDAVLDGFLRHRPREASVLDILRLGAAQLLFLATPAHAAVAESVALAAARFRHETGLVNAVLRRVAREGAAVVEGQDAARVNTPRWLFESWERAYGAAGARAIAEAHLREAPLDFSVKADPAVWADRLGARVLPGGTLRRAAGGLIESLPGYAEGAWWVQDLAAALPARLLGPVAGREVLDLGAAPGGKTAQLAAAGAKVTAVELSPGRAERLRDNLARLRLEARIEMADARVWRPEAPCGLILLDVPCSATGTIRRHPDVPRHKSPAEVLRMAALQAELLRAAVAMLAPSGTLVYASCSLQPEEGPEQIARLLAEGVPLVRSPVARGELSGLPVELTDEGEVRTLPCHMAEDGGMDGFFVARLRRAG